LLGTQTKTITGKLLSLKVEHKLICGGCASLCWLKLTLQFIGVHISIKNPSISLMYATV